MSNVVFVMNNLGGGGAERVGLTVAAQLARRGHDVYVARMFKTQNDYDPVGVRAVATLPCARNRVIKHFLRLIALSALRIRWRADALIVMGVGDPMIRCFHRLHPRVRLILSERNDPAAQYRADARLGARVHAQLAEADRVVFQTAEAMAYFGPAVRARGVIIPNPIAPGLPAPYAGPRRREIVNFCRLSPQKNLPLLIRAFERVHRAHPDYTLRIYGRGALRGELLRAIRAGGLAGCAFIEDFAPDIHDRVRDAAMFVSSSDYEGISNSMLEAMAIGLPVVCTDCPAGGARMAIEHGVNGLLTPVGDEAALAAAMLRLIERPDEAARMGQNAAAVRQRFGAREIGAQWAALL